MIDLSTIKKYEGIVVGRTGAVSGNPPEGDPAVITYDAIAVNTLDSVKLVNHNPKRRVSRGAKVLVAEIGDPCDIVRVGREFFLYVHEGVPFTEACP